MVHLGSFRSSGLIVVDPAYEPADGLGVPIPTAAPGAWDVWVSASDRGASRVFEARCGPVERWVLVEPCLTTDTCEVGIYDAAFYVRERAVVRGSGTGDKVLAGGAQAGCCYDPWRCAVYVAEVAGAVVGVRVVWYSADLPRRVWSLEPVGRWQNAQLEGRTLTLFSDTSVVSVNLLDVYWEGEELLVAAGVPLQLCADLRPVLRAHGVLEGR